MTIKPLGDRVLVKIVEIEEKTKGGLLIPDTASKDKTTYGEVLAVGNGEKVKDIKAGDKIIYGKYTGTELKDNGEKYLLLNMEDVLAIVEE